MLNLSFSELIASLVFGSIGFVAFIYGKKTGQWKPMAGGVALSVLPMLVHEAIPMSIGSVLILVAMYVFRD